MGKFNSIVSFTGSTGAMVGMKGRNGRTYTRVRVYEVANPNTAKQIAVRAKMVLAGLLSKLTDASLLFGMKGNDKVARRSRFTSHIFKRTTVTAGAANLAPADLVFSEGNSYPIPAVTAAFSGGSLNLSVAAWDNRLASLILIAVFSENRTGNYIEIQEAILTANNLTASLQSSAAVANLYAIPVVQKEGATAVDYADAIANIEASNSYKVAVDALTSGVFEYGASDYLQSVANS